MLDEFKNPLQKQLAIRALWRKNPNLEGLEKFDELVAYISDIKSSRPRYDYRGNERGNFKGLNKQINEVLANQDNLQKHHIDLIKKLKKYLQHCQKALD